jgi:hypothetical protein
MKASIPILLVLLTIAPLATAQSHKARIELGVQSTSLTLFDPDFPGDVTEPGLGGRVGYNITRSLAVESEVNFFPQKRTYFFGEGRTLQAQFGVKAGKRFDKFGIFAKVRPGLLTAGKVFRLEPGSSVTIGGFTQPNARFDRKTLFTIDIGGVLEFYPSKRTLFRLEAGDTLVRHYKKYEYATGNFPNLVVVRGAKFKNNFQFTAGFGFRLGDFDNSTSTVNNDNEVPRFEVGAQFTSMSVNSPAIACGACGLIGSVSSHTEPGFGGRFTFNLTDNIGFEAESDFFTRERLTGIEPGGHMVLSQFGVKAGKRFNHWGLFGKARPGFVMFTKANELVGTHTQPFGSIMITVGDFAVNKTFYPSFDLGGVAEFYISRRWMTRVDFGDTIIRYGEYVVPGFVASQAIVRRPPETRHNFQFTSGIGFRF